MSGETSVPEKVHSELGASVAARWMACPGSVQLARTVPVPPSTSFAEEGTRAHAVAELCLTKGVEPDFFVGMELEGGPVTEEMAEFVKVYVDHCNSFINAADGQVLHWVEKRFNLAPLNPPGPMFGTADFVWAHPESGGMGIVDLKYGQGVVVEAKGNKQLRYYALGALLSLPKGTVPDTVTMTIVQPRASHPDGAIRSETIPVEELLGFSAELMEAARKTLEPNAPLAAGPHCKFCPAAGICPEQLRAAQEVAMVEFDLLDEGMQLEPQAPETLTPVQLVNVMKLLPMLEDWAASVRAVVKEKLERGEDVPGYKLVATRPTRKWIDPNGTEQWLRAKGFESEEIFEQKLKSPAQVEKLVGKKNLPPEYVIKVSSGYTVADANDKRPAVSLTAGSEFPALPPGE